MFQTAATIHKVETLSDNSIKLSVVTQELGSDASELFALRNRLGWFLFKESEIKPEDLDLPDEIPSVRGDKTPGQRLRGVLYKLWESQTQRTKTFEDFYRSEMERIIEHYKEKLN